MERFTTRLISHFAEQTKCHQPTAREKCGFYQISTILNSFTSFALSLVRREKHPMGNLLTGIYHIEMEITHQVVYFASKQMVQYL